jgi:inosose dehydratase
VFTVPGDGCVDFVSLVRALLRGGYRGWFVVEAEQDPAIAEPRKFARMGYEYLAPLVQGS